MMREKYFYCLLLTVYCLLLLSACGRRGDPVLVEPPGTKAAEKEPDEMQGTGTELKDDSLEIKKDEKSEIQAVPPAAPTGLRGIYTQTSIVLTWDEVAGQDIRYRIYRSSGDGYVLAGETVTPAFTDRNVEQGKRYRYRIIAVGAAEGPPSEEIIIGTEMQ